MSRCDELKWEYNDKYKEWRLYGPLYSWSQKYFLLARLRETTIKNKYVWSLADFKEETEAPGVYSVSGSEYFDTIDEAKTIVICNLADKIYSTIAELKEIAELFS